MGKFTYSDQRWVEITFDFVRMICGCATLKESLNMVPRAKNAEAADDEALPAVDAAELAADPPVGEAMPVVVEDWNLSENQKRNELKQERTWWERFNPLFDAGGELFWELFFFLFVSYLNLFCPFSLQFA